MEEAAYKKGYEDGFDAGSAAAVYEIERDENFNALPLEDRTRIMLNELFKKQDNAN